MFQPTLTIVGNLTRDPEPFTTAEGTRGAHLTIAHTPKTFDRRANQWIDGEPIFMRAVLWREQAENITASARKGDRVIAVGTLERNTYMTREGERRQGFQLHVQEIGASWRYGPTRQINRAQRRARDNAAAKAPASEQEATKGAECPEVTRPGSAEISGF